MQDYGRLKLRSVQTVRFCCFSLPSFCAVILSPVVSNTDVIATGMPEVDTDYEQLCGSKGGGRRMQWDAYDLTVAAPHCVNSGVCVCV